MPSELTAIPAAIVAGDSYRLTLSRASYPASAGWVVALALTGAASAATFTATGTGDTHVMSLTSESTAALEAGVYRYALTATLDGERTTLETGSLSVAPNVAGAAAGALASYAESMLALCRTARQNILRGELKSYQMGGRQVQLHTLGELAKEEAHWRRELAREKGNGSGFSTLAVRFVR